MTAIQKKIQKYHQARGGLPASILVGPNDFLAVSEYVKNSLPPEMQNYPAYLQQHLTFLFGVPIRVKQGGGIDIELNPADINHYVIGTVKEEEKNETRE